VNSVEMLCLFGTTFGAAVAIKDSNNSEKYPLHPFSYKRNRSRIETDYFGALWSFFV